MLTAVCVASTIDANHVNKHKIKFASIFQLFPDVLLDIVIESVQIVGIETGPVLVAIEPFSELWSPNVVTVEDNASIVTLLVVDLLQDVVLHKFVGEDAFRDLEHGVEYAREESLDANDGGRWELGLEREQESVLWILVHIVFEKSDFLSLVGVGSLTVEIEALFLGPLEEVLSKGIEEHKDDFAARFFMLLSHRAHLCELGARDEETIKDKLH